MTIKHPVFNLLQGTFQRVARGLQRVALASAKKAATLLDVLQDESVAQCVAEILQPTQRDARRCNTATLLFLKNNNSTHTHTYTHTYRASIGTGCNLLRPIASGSVGVMP